MSLINLLSIGPGTFIYHLLILLALGAMTGITLIEWRRTHTPDQRRLLRVLGGLLGIRLLLLFGEPLGPAIVAPLHNGIELASLTLLGWAFFSPLLSQRARIVYLVGGLGVALVCSVTFLPGWYRLLGQGLPNLLYTTFWQQTFWYAVSMLLALIPALIPFHFRLHRQSWILISGFTILFLGFTTLCVGALSFTLGWLDVIEHSALIGIGRLINLLSYPFFTTAIHRLTLQAGDWQHEGPEDAAARLETQELYSLVEISRTISESPDLGTILSRVSESTTRALEADRCAILIVDPETRGSVSLAAQHNSTPHTESETSPSTSSLAEQPTLAYALSRRKPLTINTEVNNPRLQALYELLGAHKTGPTLVQPILYRRQALGALVMGNDHSQRSFDAADSRLCQSIAAQLATAIENARIYDTLEVQTRKLAQLQQSHAGQDQRFKHVLQSTAEGILVSDTRGQIVSVNAAAERILNVSRQQLLGHPLARLTGYAASNPMLDWNTIAQSDAPVQATFESEEQVLHVHAAPVITPAGERVGSVSLLRDITTETQSERAKNEFITAISQELRTPLTAIRGYAESLSSMDGPTSENQARFLDIIRENALHVASLVENLVTVSQVEKGLLKLEYGQANLHRLINDVVRSFKNQIEARQLEVSLELDDSLSQIEADPARVRQILTNLISNAIKFTYPGGHITVGDRPLVDNKKKYCAIWVSDTGIGISPEEQAHVWQQFYRPSGPMTAKASGMGVGLFIVKALAEAHGGRVSLKSEPGVGSTFTALLPIKRDGGR